MMKSPLLNSIVALLLVLSGWQGVLAASLCPHTRAARASCCRAAQDAVAAGHHAHEAMQMDDAMEGMEMHPPAASVNTGCSADESAERVGQPVADCAHCAGHARFPAAPVAAPGMSGESLKTIAPHAAQLFASQPPAYARLISSRPHAPPEPSAPLRLLISLFRI